MVRVLSTLIPALFAATSSLACVCATEVLIDQSDYEALFVGQVVSVDTVEVELKSGPPPPGPYIFTVEVVASWKGPGPGPHRVRNYLNDCQLPIRLGETWLIAASTFDDIIMLNGCSQSARLDRGLRYIAQLGPPPTASELYQPPDVSIPTLLARIAEDESAWFDPVLAVGVQGEAAVGAMDALIARLGKSGPRDWCTPKAVLWIDPFDPRLPEALARHAEDSSREWNPRPSTILDPGPVDQSSLAGLEPLVEHPNPEVRSWLIESLPNPALDSATEIALIKHGLTDDISHIQWVARRRAQLALPDPAWGEDARVSLMREAAVVDPKWAILWCPSVPGFLATETIHTVLDTWNRPGADNMVMSSVEQLMEDCAFTPDEFWTIRVRGDLSQHSFRFATMAAIAERECGPGFE